MGRKYSHPTLLLCGIAGGSASLLPLRRKLRRSGVYAQRWFAPLVLTRSVSYYAQHVRKRIAKIHSRTGQKVTLVGWSLGGLIAVMAMQDPLTASQVRRVITFGSPFDGTVLAHAGKFLGLQLLEGAKDALPESETLETLRKIVADPGRQWEFVTINGSLDPLAKYPLRTIKADKALNGPFTHLAPFTSKVLQSKIVQLIRWP